MKPKTLIQPRAPKLSHISDSGTITADFEKRCKEYKDAGDKLIPTTLLTHRRRAKGTLKEGVMPVTVQETELENHGVYETIILN